MFPWERLQNDIKVGFERICSGTLLAPDRIAQEADVLKLSMKLRRLNDRLDALYMTTGRRAYDQYKIEGSLNSKDLELQRLLEDIKQTVSQREQIRAELEDLRS